MAAHTPYCGTYNTYSTAPFWLHSRRSSPGFQAVVFHSFAAGTWMQSFYPLPPPLISCSFHSLPPSLSPLPPRVVLKGRRTFPRSYAPPENLFQLVPSSRTKSYNGDSKLVTLRYEERGGNKRWHNCDKIFQGFGPSPAKTRNSKWLPGGLLGTGTQVPLWPASVAGGWWEWRFFEPGARNRGRACWRRVG